MNATIDLALFSAFLEVAEASSFSKAARALGTTTATASRSVARLEESLGTRLFHRTSRKVTMTSAGAALYERTALHFRALKSAAQELPEQQSEPAGVLKLTAPYDLGATILGGLIARFAIRYPKVRIAAEFSSRNVDLGAEGFDVAIRSDSLKVDASWTVRRLVRKTELNFYAAPTYVARRGAPRALAVSDHDWLIAGPLRRLLQVPANFESRIVANDFLFLREAARAGAGVAMLPAFIARPYVTAGELTRVLPTVRLPVGGLALVYAPTRPLPLKVAAFRDFLLQNIEREWLE
jgi:DNA-binding transcriptional LysR family regulator